MANYLYVDNSNVWIEGRRVAAVENGLAPTLHDAMQSKTVDMTWTYDFGSLYRLACPEDEKLGRTALFGSTPPPSDTIWKIAESEGFEVHLFERNAFGNEKQVDTAIVAMMVADAFTYMKSGDRVVLVAGDADFVPGLEIAKSRGAEARIMFWSHASRAIKEAADEFVELNAHFADLSR